MRNLIRRYVYGKENMNIETKVLSKEETAGKYNCMQNMIKKILIIEDEAAIQKILSEPLTFAGYNVTAVSDGLEGINEFHRQKFDLILLDIMLPKIDGYTVCEMVRQESQIHQF